MPSAISSSRRRTCLSVRFLCPRQLRLIDELLGIGVRFVGKKRRQPVILRAAGHDDQYIYILVFLDNQTLAITKTKHQCL